MEKIVLFRTLFLFILVKIKVSSPQEINTGKINFGQLLDAFQDCLVLLLNYQGLDVVSSHTPVTISRLPSLKESINDFKPQSKSITGHHESQKSAWSANSISELKSSRLQLRSACVALFYLTPSIRPSHTGNNEDVTHVEDVGVGDGNSSDGVWGMTQTDQKRRYSLNVPSQFKELFNGKWMEKAIYRRRDRYMILVRRPGDDDISLWKDAYSTALFINQIPSRGLILTMSKTREASTRVILADQLLLVNQFHLTTGKFTLVEINMSSALKLGIWGRYHLNQEIDIINDVRSNWIAGWRVEKSMSGFMVYLGGNYRWQVFVKKLFWEGALRINDASYLRPKNSATEGMENYLFAKLVLGPNTTMTTDPSNFDGFGGSQTPYITFDSRKTTYFGKSRELAMITCSDKLRTKFSTGFMYFWASFLSQFELRVWFGIILAYLVPAILFALVYYCSRIKKMHGKKPMGHPSFTIGLHNLVNQCVDRKWNHRKFGFMACVVVPWLLGAVIVSNGFRGSNIQLVNRPNSFTYHRRLGLRTVHRMGLKILSAVGIEGGFSQDYNDLADVIVKNKSYVLISTSNGIQAIENTIKEGKNRFSCSMPISSHGFQEEKSGWEIGNWMDDKILWRITKLDESGIAWKWREVMRPGRINRQWGGGGVYIRSSSMASNLWYVFMLGLYGMVVAGCVWFVENALPVALRGYKRRSKLKMSSSGEIRRIVEGLNKLFGRK